MTFVLLARADDGSVTLLSDVAFASRHEAVDALGLLLADPEFAFADQELLLVDLDTAAPVMVVTPPEGVELEPLAEEEVEAAFDRDDMTDTPVDEDVLVEELLVEEAVSARVVEAVLASDEIFATDAEDVGGAELLVPEGPDVAETKLQIDLTDTDRATPLPVEPLEMTAPPEPAAVEDVAIADAIVAQASQAGLVPDGEEVAPVPQASVSWPWDASEDLTSAPEAPSVPPTEPFEDQATTTPPAAEPDAVAVPLAEPPAPPAPVFDPLEEPAVDATPLLVTPDVNATEPTVGTDLIDDTAEVAEQPSATEVVHVVQAVEISDYIVEVATPAPAATETVPLDNVDAASNLPSPGGGEVSAGQAGPAAAGAVATASTATLTCDDCVYVATCPNQEQLDPTNCGSFQWRSL